MFLVNQLFRASSLTNLGSKLPQLGSGILVVWIKIFSGKIPEGVRRLFKRPVRTQAAICKVGKVGKVEAEGVMNV